MTRFCESAIENLLLKKGFKIKSAAGLKEIERRKRDAALRVTVLEPRRIDLLVE